jgi:aspartyl-tRNA(Asn)/glutamyl-tRNA(Gln) amidotransferase subunit C
MTISLDDVRRVAYLARIEVTDAEVVAVHEKLAGVFGMIEQMQKIDTEGVEPMSHGQDIPLRQRADKVTEIDRHEAFQAIAPQVENSLYLVPRVIE